MLKKKILCWNIDFIDKIFWYALFLRNKTKKIYDHRHHHYLLNCSTQIVVSLLFVKLLMQSWNIKAFTLITSWEDVIVVVIWLTSFNCAILYLGQYCSYALKVFSNDRDAASALNSRGQCCCSYWPLFTWTCGPYNCLHFLQDALRNVAWNSLGLDIFVL